MEKIRNLDDDQSDQGSYTYDSGIENYSTIHTTSSNTRTGIYSQRQEMEDPFVDFNEELAQENATQEGLTVDEWVNQDKKLAALIDDAKVTPVNRVSKIPKNYQKRLRTELNASRHGDDIISYEDIDENSSSFDKKKARLLVLAYNDYLNHKSTSSITESRLSHELQEIKTYPLSKLNKRFISIPKEVKHEILSSLGLHPSNISHYKKEAKQKIVALFNLEYQSQ